MDLHRIKEGMFSNYTDFCAPQRSLFGKTLSITLISGSAVLLWMFTTLQATRNFTGELCKDTSYLDFPQQLFIKEQETYTWLQGGPNGASPLSWHTADLSVHEVCACVCAYRGTCTYGSGAVFRIETWPGNRREAIFIFPSKLVLFPNYAARVHLLAVNIVVPSS